MNITEKQIDNHELELTIEVEAAEFSKAIKRAVKMLSDRVSIPGFRKGKVPQAILEQRVGKATIVEEASEYMVNKASREALREKNLMPVTETRPKIVTNEEGQNFVFTLTFTPFPKVTLGEYKNLDAEKVVEAVTDEQVAEQL